METELEQALRTAREWAADEEDRGRIARMARVFLATHARLGEVERERDEWLAAWTRENARKTNAYIRATAAESRLADAERLGAREALTRIVEEMPSPRYAEDIRAFRDREYPAPSPVGGEHLATPQAAPERVVIRVRTDEDFVMQVMGKDAYITLTPEPCQRIVETARAARPTGEG